MKLFISLFYNEGDFLLKIIQHYVRQEKSIRLSRKEKNRAMKIIKSLLMLFSDTLDSDFEMEELVNS